VLTDPPPDPQTQAPLFRTPSTTWLKPSPGKGSAG
jgi:hypothetical protein